MWKINVLELRNVDFIKFLEIGKNNIGDWSNLKIGKINMLPNFWYFWELGFKLVFRKIFWIVKSIIRNSNLKYKCLHIFVLLLDSGKFCNFELEKINIKDCYKYNLKIKKIKYINIYKEFFFLIWYIRYL